ncbi:MAG: ribonuclease Z [Spirochaetales bacterium]|nr:MAG: ribonuclease Z [Spirochaetales bacterium]
MNLEAFILGCGGMMPLPGRHLTSVLLRREGELFLFDCGEGTQVSLKKLNLRWKKISVIFVSHTHADHITGLPGILMLSSQVERNEPLYIIGPPRIKDYIETSCEVLDMYINYEIVIKEVTEPGIVFAGEDFRVKAFFLKHRKPVLGYSLEEDIRPGTFFPDKAVQAGVPKGPLWSRLQAGESVELAAGSPADGEKRVVQPGEVMGPPRKGRKFSFVTDSLYFPEIAPHVENSDLFICEGMFGEDLSESAFEKRHMTAAQAAQIAKGAGGVKKMGLIHYSPRYTDRELKHLLAEAKRIFPATFLTRDGMTLEIPHED